MTQLFADGDAHPIGAGPVFPGVEYKIGIGLSGGGIQPPEDMIQFQAAGKFHSIPSLKRQNKTVQKTRQARGNGSSG
jgi:hypothetical protein